MSVDQAIIGLNNDFSLIGARPLAESHWALGNRVQWSFNQNTTIFLNECKAVVTLPHPQHVSVPQVSANWSVFSTACWSNYKENITAQHYDSCDRWIPPKGPIMWKAFPRHEWRFFTNTNRIVKERALEGLIHICFSTVCIFMINYGIVWFRRITGANLYDGVCIFSCYHTTIITPNVHKDINPGGPSYHKLANTHLSFMTRVWI